MGIFKRRRKQGQKQTGKDPYVCAVIVAAGNSARMEGVNKLLVPIRDVPVIIWTVQAFEQCDVIDEIVVVARDGDIPVFSKLCEEYGIKKVKAIVRGGSSRQESVARGIVYASLGCDYLCIHDGARPFVTCDLITRVVEDAVRYGAAIAAVPVKDTVKFATSDGFAGETPQRSFLRQVQTPQAFYKERYSRALADAKKNSIEFTDDSQLFEAMGLPVFITQGSYRNLKLTTPEDFLIAEAFLNAEE